MGVGAMGVNNAAMRDRAFRTMLDIFEGGGSTTLTLLGAAQRGNAE